MPLSNKIDAFAGNSFYRFFSKVAIEYKNFLTKRESFDLLSESDVDIVTEEARRRTLICAYFWRKQRKIKKKYEKYFIFHPRSYAMREVN